MTGPGKSYRKGITLLELYQMFPDDEAAERWFVEARWPDGMRCAHCGGENVAAKANHPSMPYHCSDCRKFFSAKTNTAMRASKVGYQKWAMAIYLLTTNLKGVSSMKLRRDIGGTQKTAWHMGHRIRDEWLNGWTFFSCPVEALGRYANEFSGRRNSRPLDTESRMRASTRGMEGKRLRYADLIAEEPRPL